MFTQLSLFIKEVFTYQMKEIKRAQNKGSQNKNLIIALFCKIY